MRQYLNALFGNDDTRRILGKSIEKSALSHALLIEGDEGSGKRTLALEIAKASICENRDKENTPLPCCACRACYLAEHNLTPDIHFISFPDRATVGVDAVREMISDTILSSTEFDTRFYIFEAANTMTTQAQNAILKVLEEPPAGVKIILLCDSAEAMLPTVRSRARLIRMERFTPSEMEAFLKTKHADLFSQFSDKRETLQEILLSAQGSIGKALDLLMPKTRQALLEERREILAILQALSQKSYAVLLEAITSLPAKRDTLQRSLSMLYTALCDLVLLKRAESPPMSFFSPLTEISEEIASLRTGALLASADAVALSLEELEKNANIATTQASLAARLRNAQKER